MNAQLVNLLSYIKSPTVVVFWKADGEYHRLSMKIIKEIDEMKAFFEESDKYIDLYNIDFNEIRVFKPIDWLI